jgi:hypothetical protein
MRNENCERREARRRELGSEIAWPNPALRRRLQGPLTKPKTDGSQRTTLGAKHALHPKTPPAGGAPRPCPTLDSGPQCKAPFRGEEIVSSLLVYSQPRVRTLCLNWALT